MDPNARKEQFSRAYVQAVAAVAGFAWAAPSVDDDSVDLTLAARGGGGTVRSPKLDVQLKCHAHPAPTEPDFAFPLKVKNYDELRDEAVLVPRVLVVVLVPDDPADWLAHAEAEMALRRCGYWVGLRGRGPTANTGSVTVRVPRAQPFSPAALAAIMGRIGTGGLP